MMQTLLVIFLAIVSVVSFVVCNKLNRDLNQLNSEVKSLLEDTGHIASDLDDHLKNEK